MLEIWAVIRDCRDGAIRRYFKHIMETLRSIGGRSCRYDVSYRILNTKDYGIPHNMPRVYIVGLRRDSTVDKVSYLQNLLVARATGNAADPNEYLHLRRELRP